jgi:hypothetical protein
MITCQMFDAPAAKFRFADAAFLSWYLGATVTVNCNEITARYRSGNTASD